MTEKQFKYLLPNRLVFLDLLRGFTVILMMIFHFSYDLNYFKIVPFDILHHPFWYLFPRVIVFLFLFIVGVALARKHQNKIHWPMFLKRQLLILILALLVSLITYLFFQDRWIYFGTLHAIFTISFMALPLLKWPKTSLAIALLLFVPSIFFNYNLPWWHMSHPSLDYISPFPWVGATLLGIFSAHTFWDLIEWTWQEKVQVMLPPFPVKSLKVLGQHSLMIYLIHQPLFFLLFNIYFFVSLKLKVLLA